MTTTDRTNATDTEFTERIAAFEAATTPPEIVREQVAAAIALRGWGIKRLAAEPEPWRDHIYALTDDALAVANGDPR